jgi:hypothetical protein
MTEPSLDKAESGRRDPSSAGTPEEPPPEGEATPEQPVAHHYGVRTAASSEADDAPASGPPQD